MGSFPWWAVGPSAWHTQYRAGSRLGGKRRAKGSAPATLATMQQLSAADAQERSSQLSCCILTPNPRVTPAGGGVVGAIMAE